MYCEPKTLEGPHLVGRASRSTRCLQRQGGEVGGQGGDEARGWCVNSPEDRPDDGSRAPQEVWVHHVRCPGHLRAP